MTVPFALLGLLEPQPRHGYELKQHYDRWLAPDRPLPFGQVYSTLARLERDGRVAVDSVDRDEGPDRKRYAITSSGEAAAPGLVGASPFAARAAPPVRAVHQGGAGGTVRRSIDALLDGQRAAHLDRMRELTELRRSGAGSRAARRLRAVPPRGRPALDRADGGPCR